MTFLENRRIVVTRSPQQAGEFVELLLERGAIPLLYPCIDIALPDDRAPLDEALHAASEGEYDWLLLTSVNTVNALAQRLAALGMNARSLSAIQVAVVGPATARSAEALLGAHVNVMPETYRGEALAAALQPQRGTRILLPQSSLADHALATALQTAGARVQVVEAYQTVLGSGGVDLPLLLGAGEVDVITFTSPSTVNNLFKRFAQEGGDPLLLSEVAIASIGMKTAAAIRAHELKVAIMPRDHTLTGLTNALEHYFVGST